MPDRNTRPVRQFFKFLPELFNPVISDHDINIKFKVFLYFVPVDEVRISFDVFIPIRRAALALHERKRSAIEQEIPEMRD